MKLNFFSMEARARRAMRRHEVLPILLASEGATVKVVGTSSVFEGLLSAPLSDRACVAWHVTAEAKDEAYLPEYTYWWYSIGERREVVDFSLDDGEGLALVMARAALLLFRESPALFHPAVATGAGELACRAGLEGLDSSKPMRYFERTIAVGERCAVLGLARWVQDPAGVTGGYREAPRRLIIEAPRGGAVIVTDDPRLISP